MPIQQLQDQSGVGSLIGMVGGYLAANPERKAKKAQLDVTNVRNKANDARADAAATDTHDNITSEIAARNATSTKNASDETNKQFQQGAYSKLLTQLHTPPPAGATPQQWVAHIQSQVPTLGLTDPKMLGDLYAEAQGVLTKAQTDDASKFVQGEMTLSGDPQKRLAQLTKRYNIERGKPGVDTKPTQQMIVDTQKQISDMEARAHQAAVEKRQSHHDQVTENQGERRIGIEQQNANKPREGRHISAQEQYFMDHGYSPPSYAEAHPHPKAGKSVGDKDWTTIQSSPAIKLLPATTKTSLQQGVSAYGVSGVVQHLNDALKTKKFPPGFNADSAQAALDALNDGE